MHVPRRGEREEFHGRMSFCSLDDPAGKGAAWMKKYNEALGIVLNPRSPNQAELEKLAKPMQNTGELRYPKLLKCFTSIEN